MNINDLKTETLEDLTTLVKCHPKIFGFDSATVIRNLKGFFGSTFDRIAEEARKETREADIAAGGTLKLDYELNGISNDYRRETIVEYQSRIRSLGRTPSEGETQKT